MKLCRFALLLTGLTAAACAPSIIVTNAPVQPTPASVADAKAAEDAMIRSLIGRLDLERYKVTIKGLTQFGDRRQGTDRNRAANDWIEAQLKSYGCSGVERLKYEYQPAPRRAPANPADAQLTNGPGSAVPRIVGGGRPRGVRTRTGVNTDSLAQSDLKLRAINSQPTTAGAREEVYCTKVGTTRPDEMYIIGPHMTNTDSTPFMQWVPSISLRENERGTQIGSGWDPHWHQPSDAFATFSDKDFRLGLNAAQTTLGAIAELVGARVIR